MFDPVWRLGLLAAAFSLGLATPVGAGLNGGGGDANSVKRIGHATVSAVSIDGKGRKATVRRGRPITLEFDFRSDSSAWCPKCTNQIVVGYARKTRRGLERMPGGKCVYSASGRRLKRNVKVRMQAPEEPGRYHVIVSAPQAYNCVRALKWRGKPRPVAALKVR
ncbi:MAG: hypothetical protein OXR84_08775 [Magnetovibrio sp.]|nr:hypothetical protein [Magnetovibrio sp.]